MAVPVTFSTAHRLHAKAHRNESQMLILVQAIFSSLHTKSPQKLVEKVYLDKSTRIPFLGVGNKINFASISCFHELVKVWCLMAIYHPEF